MQSLGGTMLALACGRMGSVMLEAGVARAPDTTVSAARQIGIRCMRPDPRRKGLMLAPLDRATDRLGLGRIRVAAVEDRVDRRSHPGRVL